MAQVIYFLSLSTKTRIKTSKKTQFKLTHNRLECIQITDFKFQNIIFC